MVFGRTAVSATTDRYAYLADTDSITITRYDDAGIAEVVLVGAFPGASR